MTGIDKFMDFSFVILEESDYKIEDGKDNDDFVIISPENWDPLVKESVLVVSTNEFYNNIVNNTNLEEACNQLDIDFPRQSYKINNRVVNDKQKMIESFAQLPGTTLPAVWCSTQAVLAYPFIWIFEKLQDSSSNLVLLDSSNSRTSIEWSIKPLDSFCRITKHLRLAKINSSGTTVDTHSIKISLECPFESDLDNCRPVICLIQVTNLDH